MMPVVPNARLIFCAASPRSSMTRGCSSSVHDPRRDDVARLAHAAEGYAADPAAAAGDKASDLRHPFGRRMHA